MKQQAQKNKKKKTKKKQEEQVPNWGHHIICILPVIHVLQLIHGHQPTLFSKRSAHWFYPVLPVTLGHWPWHRVMSFFSRTRPCVHYSAKETQHFWRCLSFGNECRSVKFRPNVTQGHWLLSWGSASKNQEIKVAFLDFHSHHVKYCVMYIMCMKASVRFHVTPCIQITGIDFEPFLNFFTLITWTDLYHLFTYFMYLIVFLPTENLRGGYCIT